MPTPAILLFEVANNPHVSSPTRSILSALLSHCADPAALSNILFVSVAQCIHALRAEGSRALVCTCGCSELIEPDPWEEQGEVLNEEMSCRLADFVLIRLSGCARERKKNVLTLSPRCPIAIGKRRE